MSENIHIKYRIGNDVVSEDFFKKNYNNQNIDFLKFELTEEILENNYENYTYKIIVEFEKIKNYNFNFKEIRLERKHKKLGYTILFYEKIIHSVIFVDEKEYKFGEFDEVSKDIIDYYYKLRELFYEEMNSISSVNKKEYKMDEIVEVSKDIIEHYNELKSNIKNIIKKDSSIILNYNN